MKIELLSPVGSMANLKAAVQKGADSVYMGMQKFGARSFATNFNESYLKQAVEICKSNDLKLFLTMNTLIKNHEIKDFFEQLSFAYSAGIDSVIIQEISFIDTIRKNFPQLRIHISTQAGVMNSYHANLLSKADRINLARELTRENIKSIRDNFKRELEIFCHGALCVCLSGSCLFSSFLGGRSGNRGKCAQPCRKKYNDKYSLSTKELCLIEKIPDIIKLNIDSIKIEGRMRTPYYVATVTSAYRQAIDSYYAGKFQISQNTIKDIEQAFSREFTKGPYSGEDVFNPKKASAQTISNKEHYKVSIKPVDCTRKKVSLQLPDITLQKSSQKQLIVRVYNKNDAIHAVKQGADIICYDMMAKDFNSVKDIVNKEGKKIYAVTPRLMFDKDISKIVSKIKSLEPDGIFAGNLAITNLNLNLPIILDYNINSFNDYDVGYYSGLKASSIISPELSIKELKQFKNKDFIVFVHGKIRLMTLGHDIEGNLIDERKGKFRAEKIFNGSEVINDKELGLLSKSKELVNSSINQFYIDTDKDVERIVQFYRNLLDNKAVNDKRIKGKYVLGWSYKGIL